MLFVCLALAVGSFLNVVIHRLPIMLERGWRRHAREMLALPPSPEDESRFDLASPRSRCPRCETPITAWQNVPVVSWLVLRGRCASCGERISVRYPLVELLTAACSVAVLAAFGWTWTAVAALGFTWALLALAFIDWDTKLLPDGITLPLLWAGLLLNAFSVFTDLPSAVIGAAAGYLTLWSVYWIFKLLTGKEGMGYGDFKLLAAFGAWFGWQVLPILILLASLAGVLIGGGVLLIRRKREAIPFGPYLAVAGFAVLLERDRLLALIGM